MSVRTRDWLKFGTLVAIAFVFGLAFASTLGLPKKGDALESIATSPPTAVAPQVTVPVTKSVSDLSDAFVGVAEHPRRHDLAEFRAVLGIDGQRRGEREREDEGVEDVLPVVVHQVVPGVVAHSPGD